MCRPSGETRWLRTQITRVETADSPALLIQTVDHTAERRGDVVLRSIDQTTGLLSRDGIVAVLEEQILAGRQSEESFTVFCVDIDDFRGINDRFGSSAADRLLEHVGVSMQAAMPFDSEVGRIHGDVFVGIAQQSSTRDARRTAEGILQALSHLHPAGETEAITTRVGAMLVDASDSAPEDLIARVEQLAQDARSETARFVVESPIEAAERRMSSGVPGVSWYQEIEEALNEERFLVLAEPLASLKGVDMVKRQELLIRLVLPRGLRVSMPRFERHAQRLGLAAGVDAWVIRKAVEKLRSEANTELEVNLGLAAVTDPSTIELLLQLADSDRKLASRMVLAVHEHLVSESLREVLAFTEELSSAGFGFCIDDHHCSAHGLRLVESIGARRVKLSPDSIRQIGPGIGSDVWLRSTIGVLRETGVEVAVPFVTDEEVFERVCALGADFAQGTFIGSAVVVD
jgi:diguanylate cyclase (GGDEF)-like protein